MKKQHTAVRESAAPLLHSGLTLVETAEPELLDELEANPRFGYCLVARLSDRVAIVSPEHADLIVKALLKAGHTPQVVKG